MGYEYEIAAHGEEIIPILIDRLRMEREDDAKLDVIRILQVMSKRSDVHIKQDTIEEVNQSLSSMKLYPLRQRAKEMLEEIKMASAKNADD